MANRATGTFDVKLEPQAPADKAKEANVGRMSIDKRYHGDLEGIGLGEMLAYMVPQNSGGYVAIERVTGSLCGRKGAFTLQHEGIMTRGDGKLEVVILPDSGTEQLTGLSGKMTINIVDGKHLYEMKFSLP